jgi:hypothetical protein
MYVRVAGLVDQRRQGLLISSQERMPKQNGGGTIDVLDTVAGYDAQHLLDVFLPPTQSDKGQKEKPTLASETNGGVDVRCTTKQLSQSRIGSVNDH